MSGMKASRIAVGLLVLAYLSLLAPSQAEPASTAPDRAKTEAGKAETTKAGPAKVEAAKPEPAKADSAKPEPAKAEPQKAEPAKAAASPTKLACKALRGDLGIFEPLRYISITIDTAKKYVKMVHEGDGKAVEFADGANGGQGRRNFVVVTDEAITYGQGHEQWKIDRYTGTLTNSDIGIPFECQLRPSERKF